MARKKELRIAEPPQPLELKKHVAVIHSSNKLSLLQRKIANALLFNAYNDLLTKEEHQIQICRLCKLIDYDSNDHKTIKRSLVNLLSTVLEWNLVDGERLDTDGTWNASSIIADAGIDGSLCTYSYSNKMRKLLHRPDMYGRLDMLVQAKFQSSYGLALYENCNRYQGLSQTPWFEITKFRKLMGVEEGKYKIFRDFKTRVLDKAVQEVNKYSGLTVTPQLRKQNRQVVAIQFLINKITKIETSNQVASFTQIALADVLKIRFGFSKKQITDTMTHYDEDYINEKIGLVEGSTSYKEGKVKNLAKYLLSALREDYQPPKAAPEKTIANEGKADIIRIDSVEADRQKRQQQALADRYNRYRDKQIMQHFEQLTNETKASVLKNFEKYLRTTARSLYQSLYEINGLSNQLVIDQLCAFLRQDRTEILEGIPTYSEWMAKEQFD